MNCIDVNIVVNAFFGDQPSSARAGETLTALRESSQKCVLLPVVASGFLRVVTNRKLIQKAAPLDIAIEFLDALLSDGLVTVADPGPTYWTAFHGLLKEHRPTHYDITDTQIAASAIALGATLYSFDRGFARFNTLSWVDPTAVS
jgi:toxin-antitoxin system PIN domain toxin